MGIRYEGFYDICGHKIPKIIEYSVYRKNKNPLEFKAYHAFHSQKGRCYRKSSYGYKYYGGKGISMEYGIDEFVSWWVYWQKKLNLKKPTISRIDHNKNYRFDNILLEEHSVNCSKILKDQIHHDWLPRSPIFICDFKTGEKLMVFNSVCSAAKFIKISKSTIFSRLRGKRLNQEFLGFSFIYI